MQLFSDHIETVTPLDFQLQGSNQIWRAAVALYAPAIVVCLVSGGNDSLATYYVARRLGIKIDAIIHINTGTGIPETTRFVRQWAADQVALSGIHYYEGQAGTTFEDYVLRKGFFGIGKQAHRLAYHYLKAGPLRRVMTFIRRGRPKAKIAMLTGIRLAESDNRKYYWAGKTVHADPGAPNNIFVNLIEHWSARDCLSILRENNAPRNEVTSLLHRSGECMCGTMQSQGERRQAAYWFPRWGRWLDDLETRVTEKFPWRWGEKGKPGSGGQKNLEEDFTLCQQCEIKKRTEK